MSKKFYSLVIIAVLIIAAVGYFGVIKQPPTEPPSLPTPEGAYIPSEEEVIKVLFPAGGEQLEIGKTYAVRWENYIGKDPLTIALQVTTPEGDTYFNEVAENVPAVESGSHEWTVTSEPTNSKYKIEIYPEENRPLVGRSRDYFSIIGESLIIVDSPEPLEEITSPLTITGKARKIFSEGEFDIQLVNIYAPGPSVIAKTVARPKGDCDWVKGEWCNFSVELSFPTKQGIKVLEFYTRDERFGKRLIHKFSLRDKTPTIVETENLVINSPTRNQTVSSPITVKGKARKIFHEGEFRIDLMAYDYPQSHPKYVESSRAVNSVKASITDECDRVMGGWCNYEAKISYSSTDVGAAEYMLYFYSGGEGDPGTPQAPKFLFALPIRLE